jgi:hypothetical protein
MWCPRQRPSSAPTSWPSRPSCAPPSRLADKRVARLKELADTVPRKDIEAAESELPAWPSAWRPWAAGLATREALVAPCRA